MCMTSQKIRLDKWLWAARFFKTRALAKKAIEGGKVHYDGNKSKPSRMVEVGATITLQQGWDKKTILVAALSEHRRGATEAQQLYAETEASVVMRVELAKQRKMQQTPQMANQGKPTKKQRRCIIQFKTDHNN